LIKYIKSVLWRVAKCLSYIEEARCLKVNTRNDTMRRAYHLVPKCNVTMSTREEWNKISRPPPVLKGLVWYTNWLRTQWGLGLASSGDPGEG